jgi:dethiobiotin synthetase
MARWLGLAAIVVARPGLGTINHTLLTVAALRQSGVRIAGVVINRYPAERATLAEETNPRVIEQWTGLSVLCIIPESTPVQRQMPGDIAHALDLVDWQRVARRE